MKFTSLKVVNLNPDIPDEQIQDLLGEKFSQYLDVQVTVGQHNARRVAYVDFKTELDAKCALRDHANVTMFGFTSHAMPCFIRPQDASTTSTNRPTEPPSDRASQNDDNGDRCMSAPRETDHHDDMAASDVHRQSSRRGVRGARRGGTRTWRGRVINIREGRGGGVRGGAAWNRGGTAVRGRAGRMYLLSSRPSRDTRGAQRPHLLEPPTRQKPYLLTALESPTDKQPEDTEGADDVECNSGLPNCTLYIGSMDSIVQEIDLQRLFSSFGFVLSVEIKHRPDKPAYAFVHFLTPDMARLARQEMTGKLIGHTVPKLGYGNVSESRYLWVGGIGPWTSVDLLKLEFSQFGSVENVEWPNNRDYAYVEFTSLQDATEALHVMNGCDHGDPPHRVRLCYASGMQMKSQLNYEHEFPSWPRRARPKPWKTQKFIHRPPGTHLPPTCKSPSRELPDRESRHWESRSQESRGREIRGQEFRHSSTKERWSRERRRSVDRRRSPERRKRSASPRHSDARKPGRRRSDSKSKKRQRRPSPSPYTSSISDGSLSAISDTSLDRGGSPVVKKKSRKRRHKHGRDTAAKAPGKKVLKLPSTTSAAKQDIDERMVVLRSELPPPGPQVHTLSTAESSGYGPSMNASAIHPYVPHPSGYYATPVAPIYPPPLHLPPPDLYLPQNPVVPAPYLPPMMPVSSYQPDIASSTSQQPQQQPVSRVEPEPAVPSQTPHSYTDMKTDKLPQRDSHRPVAASVSSSTGSHGGANKGTGSSSSTAAQFPKVWSGALVLRNAAFVVDLHLVSGSVLLTNSLLGKNDQSGSDADCPVLRIAQRMRLDQPDKLDELSKRLKMAGRVGCSVLLATSAGAQVDDDANVVQQYPLSSLVSYLLQKQVAAVVSLPPTCVEATGVLHAFPRCQFATEFLQREAPGLPGNCPADDELLVVLCQN